MRYMTLALSISLLFSQELEVEGNLKVQGNIDASNQRVTNVGIPTELTDAVNTEFLQDALRDDGPYEYKIYRVLNQQNDHATEYYELDSGGVNYLDNFTAELNNLSSDGWTIDSYNSFSHSGIFWADVVLKRPISE